MAEQMRPASPQQAPDPSSSYERSHPDREAGMGRMENNPSTPIDEPDKQAQAVPNRQPPKGVTAEEITNARAKKS